MDQNGVAGRMAHRVVAPILLDPVQIDMEQAAWCATLEADRVLGQHNRPDSRGLGRPVSESCMTVIFDALAGRLHSTLRASVSWLAWRSSSLRLALSVTSQFTPTMRAGSPGF